MSEIKITPVGFIRNNSTEPSWSDAASGLSWQERAARMKDQRESASEIVIDAGLSDTLEGIERFSHITVIYWAHLVPEERRRTRKVHPLGNKDFPLVGVFATHSPVRPNSILTTTARLFKREGNILKVTGLDALDGSPVLDIKPYNGEHPENCEVPEWMTQVHENFAGESSGAQEKSDG
jgi:tRNA-Thr(GGU) m(6)t(6)A37 methyltransferase TsaA